MLHLAPRDLPALPDLYAALGNPTALALARLLGVTPPTVRNWLRRSKAPRSARLAMFWLTPWGQSAIDADLANRAAIHQAHAAALDLECRELRHELARLASLAHYGSANAPSLRAGLLIWRVK